MPSVPFGRSRVIGGTECQPSPPGADRWEGASRGRWRPSLGALPLSHPSDPQAGDRILFQNHGAKISSTAIFASHIAVRSSYTKVTQSIVIGNLNLFCTFTP